MLMKEESDYRALENERQQIQCIIRAITPRDASGSHGIRDVRRVDLETTYSSILR